MGLLPPRSRDPRARLLALALASGVPLAAYLATLSLHGHWGDAGALTAAAVDLDVVHPPGFALASLWGRLFALLPLGPLPMRVALGQAVAIAGAAAFLYQAADTTVRAMGAARDALAVPLALGATWMVATSAVWWTHAVRPDPHGIELLTLAIVLERVIALEAAWPTVDLAPLHVGAFAFGLALAAHPSVALLILPAAAPTLARVLRARGRRPLLIALAFTALAFAVTVALPLRSAADPPIDLGDPETLGGALAVLGGAEVPATPAASLGEALRALFESLHPIPLLLAAGGVVASIRMAGARRLAVVWILTVGLALLAPAWLGSEAGALLAVAGLGVLAAAFVAALLARFGTRPSGNPHTIAVVVALGVAALGLAQLRGSADRASLATFHATDSFDELAWRRLPTGAVVLVREPETVARWWSLRAVEGLRSDVAVVPLGLLGIAGKPQQLADRHPDLARLLRAVLIEGELRTPDLQTLAARRPLLLELDASVPAPVLATLAPRRVFFEALDGGATDADVRDAVPAREAALAALYRDLGPDQEEPATRRRLHAWAVEDAFFLAAVGARPAARTAVARGLALREDPTLRALAGALAGEEDGPVDVAALRETP
jgi:hypothetical protein